MANATNNYSLQPQQQHMPLKNKYHYNQIPDQTNTQHHNNYIQQHNTAPQVLSQLQYSTVTVQPTNLTQHGQHHVSTSPSSNDVNTHVDTTRSLPYPVCDNTTTVTNLPYPTIVITKYSGVSRISFRGGGGGSKYFCNSGGICLVRSAMQRVAKPRLC